MSNRTFVIGVGMTKFEKPGTKEGDYPDWAKEAGEKALADAYGMTPQKIAGRIGKWVAEGARTNTKG